MSGMAFSNVTLISVIILFAGLAQCYQPYRIYGSTSRYPYMTRGSYSTSRWYLPYATSTARPLQQQSTETSSVAPTTKTVLKNVFFITCSDCNVLSEVDVNKTPLKLQASPLRFLRNSLARDMEQNVNYIKLL